ncbi:DUF2301 domain-containing membrane protein [Geitlerinema sp. PCC 9228]|jgi:uncharacterized integral membrane protein|uniref:DUF2301 domain-containing membrane protein n=1 Tax=Geitlerinema sp. PCC 9228 TaxID=111611 RepID=UPI0008F9C6C6|nr:DUF2301 domain-containing membrane protein [Geitlerinema sp. PCC 9228]
MQSVQEEPKVYQGQFGEYTITDEDRREVWVYRFSLTVAAVCVVAATGLVAWQGEAAVAWLTPIYSIFCLALGVSLLTIHIYMAILHRVLQVFWGVGTLSSLALALQTQEPLALAVYQHPNWLWGIGFLFAALTGIYFKEAFCFDRVETKFLTALLPLLVSGHLFGFLSPQPAIVLLSLWSVLFAIFAFRKFFQPASCDIGDKSVFAYLRGELEA